MGVAMADRELPHIVGEEQTSGHDLGQNLQQLLRSEEAFLEAGVQEFLVEFEHVVHIRGDAEIMLQFMTAGADHLAEGMVAIE